MQSIENIYKNMRKYSIIINYCKQFLCLSVLTNIEDKTGVQGQNKYKATPTVQIARVADFQNTV
jgi:hypothetical protein